MTERPTRQTFSQRHGPNRVALAQKNMTKRKRKTTIKASTTDTRMPAARKELSTKTKFFNLCFKKCYETLQQYRVSKSDKVMKQLDWTYTKMQEQKADIKAILDELDVITPEEYDTYLQMDKAVYDLKEFMTAAFKDIAIEIRGAELKAKEEARLKAEAEAELRAEEEARLRAEEEARLKAEADAERTAEEEARHRAEVETELKNSESKANVQPSGTPPEPPGPEPPRPEPPRPEPPRSGPPRSAKPRLGPPNKADKARSAKTRSDKARKAAEKT